MNKTAIKNYAVWARNELITRVTRKAFEYGIDKDNIIDVNTDNINGRILTDDESKQRKELIKEIKDKGFEQVIEEVAYTWFNRFIALRFMEVNNYLPNKIRIFTNYDNEFKPQILDEAMNLELEGLDKELVYELLDTNNKDELYKQLLIATCNDMGNYLPGMFTKISDYKVLLFPDNLLNQDSVLGHLVTDIEEDSWNDQIQLIGWLYQYYISERHNQVINIMKGTVKKEDIPAATQLWTTDWVVRYMVDNSLGRYWVERNPNSELKNKLEYLATPKEGNLQYIDEEISPEQLTFLDPCMGSGHILVYAFDILMDIYRERGYTDREAAKLIVEKNLFGLDIDERAYQLSYFAIMMKARSYNRKILMLEVENNLSNIVETNMIEDTAFIGMIDRIDMEKITDYLVSTFKDALEIGSLIEVRNYDYDSYTNYLNELKNASEFTTDYFYWQENIYPVLLELVKQAKILYNKYAIVTTNPPYMGKMEGKLKTFVTTYYKDYSSDLFAVFMKRNFDLTVEGGYLAFMTPFVWMFIKSYEKLREYIINNKNITTLVQMEYSAYEEATVPICSFVLQNKKEYKQGLYIRLSDFKGGMDVQKVKTLEAINNHDCGFYYESSATNFSKIPGSPIAYWMSDNFIKAFKNGVFVGTIASPKKGLDTADNNRFVREWFEPSIVKVGFNLDADNAKESNRKWFPLNSGGNFRKWYGNFDKIINWENNGYEIRMYPKAFIRAKDYYFREALSWTKISSSKFGIRYAPNGFIFDSAGQSIFAEKENLFYILGFLCTNIAFEILKTLNPTLNYQVGDVANVPILINDGAKNLVEYIVKKNVTISQMDWDSFETSWDFEEHPFIKYSNMLWDATGIGATMREYYGDNIPRHHSPLELCFLLWQGECNERFNTLKSNEEELNRIFIDIYGLQDELTPEVEDKDVTVRKADLKRDVKSFVSYAVGCMFGRYSLNQKGLAFAGGEFDESKYRSFKPDVDNIIPICDDEYFTDDITAKFIEFVSVVFGKESLNNNLSFIAQSLGGKGNPKDAIRSYFLNDFYKDHCKMYQKRPIYWLFDSGKKNGFKALIYLHRYQPDLIARMRTQYVFEQQSRYKNQIDLLENQLNNDISSSEKIRLNKQLKKFKEQNEELRQYEEKVHHYADKMIDIDLDDGVKVNYEKFKDLLSKIK